MSFILFTDGCSNLPGSLLQQLDIRVLPCTYFVEGEPVTFSGDIASFDAHAYYDLLRSGKNITTSLLNTQTFLDHFRPVLEEGHDLMYVGMSSGISGTLQAARIAAEELKDSFPDRSIQVVDSLGAGLGTGLLTCSAADLRAEGLDVNQAAQRMEQLRDGLNQLFTVDDLMFLRRSGRLSTASALAGTLLGIKPLLRGDEEGHIVMKSKYRGRKKVIEAMVQRYQEQVVDPAHARVAISHGDCLEDAQILADAINKAAKPAQLVICPHEPFTGAHVGPGMLALFFYGTSR